MSRPLPGRELLQLAGAMGGARERERWPVWEKERERERSERDSPPDVLLGRRRLSPRMRPYIYKGAVAKIAEL